MSSLSYTSGLSILAVVVIVFAVAIQGPSEAKDQGVEHHAGEFFHNEWFAGLGGMSFAFVCQHSSFLVFNSMKERTLEQWNIVSFWSIFVSYVMCMVMAIAGFLSFDSTVEGDVLVNFDYDDAIINIARALLAFTMVFTFPMEQYVARHCIYELMSRFQNTPADARSSTKLHVGITTCLWGLATVIGMNITELGVVLELTGAFSGSLVAYVFPAAIWLRLEGFNREYSRIKDLCFRESPYTCQEKCKESFKFCFSCFLIVFGTVACLAGTYSAIDSAVS